MREQIGWREKLRDTEDSDMFLCVGVEALVIGVSLLSVPAACILTGLAFIGLAYLTAPRTVLPRQGAAHGAS